RWAVRDGMREASRSEGSFPFARLAPRETARTATVPPGCCPMRRLLRRSPWLVGTATTCVARLASIRIGPCSAIAIVMQRLPGALDDAFGHASTGGPGYPIAGHVRGFA